MTGELDSIPKDILSLALDSHRKNEQVNSPVLLSGTIVVKGDGAMIVTAVGVNSMEGKNQPSIETSNSEPLKIERTNLRVYIDVFKFKLQSLYRTILFSIIVFLVILYVNRFLNLVNLSIQSEYQAHFEAFVKYFGIFITCYILADTNAIEFILTTELARSIFDMMRGKSSFTLTNFLNS